MSVAAADAPRARTCRTPESVGDYASGTNHVLPTYGYARMYSGVALDSFQKKMTVQARALGGHVSPATSVWLKRPHQRAEQGFDQHARCSVQRRLQLLDCLVFASGTQRETVRPAACRC